jgi:hypothetical protein
VKDPEFTANLAAVPLEELRARRDLCDELDTEFSYYRRLLHGRMDLLAFEQRRRTGEETRSLIEALPEILAGSDVGAPLRTEVAKPLPIDPPDPGEGRRAIDRVLGDDFLTHLPTIDNSELDEIREMLASTERDISAERREVYGAMEIILEEITRRYQEGLADVDELLSHD